MDFYIKERRAAPLASLPPDHFNTVKYSDEMTNGNIALLLLAASSAAVAAPEHGGRAGCKAYPGTPAWPRDDAWSALKEAVGGRLIKPTILPGGVCHQGQPNYDESKCAAVAKEWTTSEFHLEDPISVMSNAFTNYTCLPDTSLPCSPSGYPAYVVNVTSAEDVKAGVDFGKPISH